MTAQAWETGILESSFLADSWLVSRSGELNLYCCLDGLLVVWPKKFLKTILWIGFWFCIKIHADNRKEREVFRFSKKSWLIQ